MSLRRLRTTATGKAKAAMAEEAALTFYYSWGLILMSGTWWLSTIFTVVFVATYYLQAIPGHELHMAKKYGGEWEEYVKTTPKYIPGFGH